MLPAGEDRCPQSTVQAKGVVPAPFLNRAPAKGAGGCPGAPWGVLCLGSPDAAGRLWTALSLLQVWNEGEAFLCSSLQGWDFRKHGTKLSNQFP